QRDVDGGVFDFFVALANFAGGERGAALGPPPNDLVPPVEQVFLDQFRQGPPDALDVGAVVGDVGVFEIGPKADLFGHALPLFGVAEDGLNAAHDERLDAVGFDGFLAVDAEFLLDLDFDRQTVGIPAGLARHVAPAHGLV